jgi:hypothetical protein
MGQYNGCGKCGAQVYVSGPRLPQHDTPEGRPCLNRNKAFGR